MKFCMKSWKSIAIGIVADKFDIDRGVDLGLCVSNIGKLEIDPTLLRAALPGMVALLRTESSFGLLKAVEPCSEF